MIFTAPLGLLALLAIPAIVAIHFFRRRFPPKTVAGLFLWGAGLKSQQSAGKVERPPVTASLILECLAALALALLLAGARFSPASAVQHLVVLLDDSASMAAVDGRGESARDRAAHSVLQELDRLGRMARVTLVLSGERPSVICGPAALPGEARTVLDGWKPQASHHSLALGLRMARELAGKRGLLLVISDALPPQPVTGARWLAVGKALPNAGITAAQRTLSPETGKAGLSLSVGNLSGTQVRRHLRVLDGPNEVLARELQLPPGASSLILQIPTGLPALRVELENDALKTDNAAFLVEPQVSVVAVDNQLPAGRAHDALEKAIAVMPRVTHARPAHLVFSATDDLNRVPQPVAGSWPVAFRAASKADSSARPQIFVGPFVPEKRHPLLLGVTLAGIVWTGAAPLTPGAVQPLLTAADVPLIALRGDRPEAGIVFNLDLDQSNLPRSPDWPILMANLIEWRRQHLPGPERWNYRVGEWVRVRLSSEPKGTLRLRSGAFERQLAAGRIVEFLAPSPAGFCQVLDGDRTLLELGVSFFDEEESDLRDRKSGEIGSFASRDRGLQSEEGSGSDPLFWVLLIAVTAALFANWFINANRTTVPESGSKGATLA